ncbi:MAG: response regulator [Candidatus Cyclobacteriaceae bacterium M3_2C_046]
MKILLADDHQMFIDGITYLIRDQGWEVAGVAKNGKEVFHIMALQGQPDVLILDIEMPEMDGIQVATRLKKEFPVIKILVLSMHDEPEFIRQMLKLNIDGYILKDAGKEELKTALKAIIAGQKYFGQKVTQNIMNSFSQPKSSTGDLSPREIDIIRLIADQKTTGQIADQLFLSKHTVETHRKNILLKLGLKNSAGLIKYAMKKGLID